MNLTHEIEVCQRCRRYESPDRLNPTEKPYVKFQVEQIWKPNNGNINVLFIAESPPWNGKQNYFYNPNTFKKRTGLRKEVLKHLNLDLLEQFKAKGYFLTDAIKCRLNKEEKNVVKKVLETCSEQFLRREITELKPKAIFVLGDSAKKALQQVPEFKDLRYNKVTEDYDKALSGYHVILCPLPCGTTRGYEITIKRAFSKIA